MSIELFSHDRRLLLALTGAANLPVGPEGWSDVDAVIDAFKVLRPKSCLGDALEATVFFSRGDMARTRRIFDQMENWETLLPDMVGSYAGALAATGSPDWEHWARRGVAHGGAAGDYCAKLLEVLSTPPGRTAA